MICEINFDLVSKICVKKFLANMCKISLAKISIKKQLKKNNKFSKKNH